MPKQVTQDIKSLGNILGVWAHPDDETFSSAGIMMQALDNGQSVTCITATKGEKGQHGNNIPDDKLAKAREIELNNAFNVIGDIDHRWLNFVDGECNRNDEQAINKIIAIIDELKPDTILTFGSDGLTGHPDHSCVYHWAVSAVNKSDLKPNLFSVIQLKSLYDQYMKKIDEDFNVFFMLEAPKLYNDKECDLIFKLSDVQKRKKCEALKCMITQTKAMFDTYEPKFLENAFSKEAFVLK